MLLGIRFHFNTIARMCMHAATNYLNMYGYMYMTFGLFNADACTKWISIEAGSKYLKYSKHASTYRLKAICMYW